MNDRSTRPQTLAVRVGSGFGQEDGVELTSRALLLIHYEGQAPVEQEERKPTDGQWRGFRRSLDNLAVWSWQERYPPPAQSGDRWAAPTDGTEWAVEIEWGTERIRSGGYMAYPEIRKRPDEEELEARRMLGFPEDCAVGDYSDDFKDFCRAISRLLGGQEFGGYISRPRR